MYASDLNMEAAKLAPSAPFRSLDIHRPVSIAYFSSDFKLSHPIGQLLLPILEAHNKKQVRSHSHVLAYVNPDSGKGQSFLPRCSSKRNQQIKCELEIRGNGGFDQIFIMNTEPRFFENVGANILP